MIVETPEFTKYSKRIEDLIEDAEIEAELEAESHIRSKNTRLLLISLVGFATLIMVYLSINSKSDQTPHERKFENAKLMDQYIPNPKPIPFPLELKNKLKSDLSESTEAPSPNQSPTFNREPKKTKITKSRAVKPTVKKARPAQALKKKSFTTFLPVDAYFIQIGAFSVKQNATNITNKIKAEGLSPKIKSLSGNPKTFSVFVGEFKNKKAAQAMGIDLKRAGFSPNLEAYGKGLYSFTVGQFKNRQTAQGFQNKLSQSGFLSNFRLNKGKAPIYIVGVGPYSTLEEVKSAHKKVKALGYPNSFQKKIG